MAATTATTVSIDDLFKPRLPEETVEIPGVGHVRIRAVSRMEMLAIRGKKLELPDIEREMLATALVEPKMTEAQVRQWQEASAAGEIEHLSNAVMKLSGMDSGAAKEAVKRFPE
jgi:hypothetical protein